MERSIDFDYVYLNTGYSRRLNKFLTRYHNKCGKISFLYDYDWDNSLKRFSVADERMARFFEPIKEEINSDLIDCVSECFDKKVEYMDEENHPMYSKKSIVIPSEEQNELFELVKTRPGGFLMKENKFGNVTDLFDHLQEYNFCACLSILDIKIIQSDKYKILYVDCDSESG